MVESYAPSARARGCWVSFLSLLFCGWASTAAHAQSANGGAITFTGGVDVPSVYVFRGIVREADPKITVAPYGNVAIALRGESGPQSTQSGGVVLNVGVWNSLQTGSSGSSGFTEHAHYEEDFTAGLTVGLGQRLTVGAAYTAFTSPNFQFDTVKEASVKVAHADWLRPYALFASELGDHGLDEGTHTGTYVEVGAGPRFELGPASLAIPVRLGASLKDYYELNGTDERFGFLSAGGVLTVPLGFVPARFGAWQLRGGGEFYTLGEFAKNANAGKSTKLVGTLGVGLVY